MDPYRLAAVLFHLADEISSCDHREPARPTEEGPSEALPEAELNRPQISGHVADLIDQLDAALAATNREPERPGEQSSYEKSWSFGRISERAPIRAVCRGYLEPVRYVPIVINVPEQVALFLITLPDGDDYLDREHHDAIGWHYHYLDRKKRRSDTILCWDTRWTNPPRPDPVSRSYRVPSRPLFHETHGEGHARFTAKPYLWGDAKRESMHNACEPDLTRSIGEFRCAANKADAVWPRGVILTARAAPTPSTANGRGRGKR